MQAKMAIEEFERRLPGWWWSIGICSVSADASCGPDIAGPDADLLDYESRVFDEGFDCDDRNGTLASSLCDVMKQALYMRDLARTGKHIPMSENYLARMKLRVP